MNFCTGTVTFMAALAMTGCGSPSTPDGAAQIDAARALFDDQFARDVTPLDQIPVSGRVRYDGFLVVRLPINQGTAPIPYSARIELSVDFAATSDTVTGTIDGFVAPDDGVLDGHLLVSHGQIHLNVDPDLDYRIAAEVDGRLADSNDVYRIDATLAGDFKGRNADAVAGVVYGDIERSDGVDVFDGEFAATAQ